MATLKQQILDMIRREHPASITNQQLATRLAANEPSVRRVTKQLEDVGLISGYMLNGFNNVLSWSARPGFDWTPTTV